MYDLHNKKLIILILANRLWSNKLFLIVILIMH